MAKLVIEKCTLALACVLPAVPVAAETVEILPDRDTTLYAESGATGNGAGEHLFAGTTRLGNVRRALVRFDVAGSLPPGATVVSARLDLYCSKAAPGSAFQTVGLHRVTGDWGEAGSDGGLEEGQGAPAQAGDATWVDRFFAQGAPWTTLGGDFVAAASATATVGGAGTPASWSSAGMSADVQGWLDLPTGNFGWLIRGNETVLQTTRRFDSGSIDFAPFRPKLTVEYETTVPDTPGAVPDGDGVPGAPLTLGKTGGAAIRLDWSAGCNAAAGEDYAVYEGTLGNFSNRFPAACSTGGQRTRDVNAAPGGTYYLVVPVRSDLQREGSYGRRSSGVERGPGTAVCFAQELATPVCP